MKTTNRVGTFMRYAATAVLLAASVTGFTFQAAAENNYSVTVDNQGRMRRSDTGEEVRFFGTNYTLPFAHAYRAMDRLGVDHKSAIDRDVYHLSRMGANAFRLHLWDVELADSVGNLLDNHHLDLLDYLISSLEERGISIILTAQTNFGNGYPERDIDTGAYSYLYGKCSIHETPQAIDAQKRYVEQLVKHTNPYTGRSYADDRSIIAIEVNNEPCHQSNPAQVTSYINSMVKSIRRGGWKKPVLYNVSHNMPLAQGYYNADIQGTTYQWYPTGLVSGKEKKGNFLPYVDSYHIPYLKLRNYGKMAKVVYEFDPADILDSYLYPAIARTFAGEGFQWATQFAYDPIDMARFNTEYQTHYLNLAYTPGKAIGMKIAAKAMERTPLGAGGSYPADTIFGDFTVSYRRNLAQLNSPREFFHTNTTADHPATIDSLREIAGVGSSPVVTYNGLGAYLLDRIKPGVWRLELLPDVLYSVDPFTHPSLNREAAHIINATHPMTLRLPDLGEEFRYQAIGASNPFGGKATEGTFNAIPGVYLLAVDSLSLASVDPEMQFGAIRLNEYVAPPAGDTPLHVNHTAPPVHNASEPLTLRAQIFGSEMPDSVLIYPADASFWRSDNHLHIMRQVAPYTFEAVISPEELIGKSVFGYRIVPFTGGTASTFPSATEGAPLDWDAPDTPLYTTRLLTPGDPAVLLSGAEGTENLEISTIPDSWSKASLGTNSGASPFRLPAILISCNEGGDSLRTVVTRNVRNVITGMGTSFSPEIMEIGIGDVAGVDSITVNLVNTDGITFSAEIPATPDSTSSVRLRDLRQAPTLLCPAPYPVFLSREFRPAEYSRPLRWEEIEKVQVVLPATGDPGSVALTGIILH